MSERSSQSTPDRLFLPQFCDLSTVLVVVLVAQLLAFALALTPTRVSTALWQDLALISLSVQWVALSSVGLLCYMRPKLRVFSNAGAGVASFALIIAVTLVWSEAAYWLVAHTASAAGGEDLLRPGRARALIVRPPLAHSEFVLRNVGISGIVAMVTLRYFYAQHRWREKLESETRARVQALQSRIRPHFLFNSMNTIAALTRSDPALAEQVTEDLADLFRACLSDASVPTTLGDELNACRQYLRIERERLGERLRVEWATDPLPAQALLPRLLVQPLIENAVYHGIEPAHDGGVIRITGVRDGNRLGLRIVNSVPATARTQSKRTGNGIALDNVRERLAGFFDGVPTSLKVTHVADDYVVELEFPYREDNLPRENYSR